MKIYTSLLLTRGMQIKSTIILLNIHRTGKTLRSLTRSSAGEDMKQLEFSPTITTRKNTLGASFKLKMHLHLHRCSTGNKRIFIAALFIKAN